MSRSGKNNLLIDTLESNQEFVQQGLKKTRNKLLDLSARNRLINFKHSSKKIIRLVDEFPDQIYSKLTNDIDGGLFLTPVPIPKKSDYPPLDVKALGEIDAIHHARKLGISVGWEMPATPTIDDERHQDNKLQTLLYPEPLDRLARRVQSEARTAIEESGVNMFFLCIGFLKWSESNDSTIFYEAPLIMVPVQIERDKVDARTGYAKFRIQYTGEDVLDNICLREKLKQLAIELPAFEDFEAPDTYFNFLKELLKDIKPEWEVHRFLTFSFLSFGKMLMYLDLDPAMWPLEGNINQLPHISDIFTGSFSEGAGFADEFDIDADPKIPQVSLVMDADSSQHSAIIDVLNGKNLVIEGPPGTGKSQTITNIIASCLAEGKSVLFVAEKLAALEVVRRRLDSVGLGDFCLELHSHKTQKKALINDLKKRIELSPKYVKAIQEAEETFIELNSKKKKLIEYSQVLNSPFTKGGETPHDVFWKTDVLYKGLSQKYNTDDFPLIESTKELSKAELNEKLEAFKNLADNLKEYFSDDFLNTSHYWHGFEIAGPIDYDQQQNIYKALKQLLKVASIALSEYTALEKLKLKLPEIAEYKLLSNKVEEFNEQDFEHAHFLTSPITGEELTVCYNLLDIYRRQNCSYSETLDICKLKENAVERIKNIDINESRLAESYSIEEIGVDTDNLRNAIKNYKEAEQIALEAANYLGINCNTHLSLNAIRVASEFCFAVDKSILGYRNQIIENSYDNPVISEVERRVKSLQDERSDINSKFHVEALPGVARLKEIDQILSKTGFFSPLSSKWRKAVKEYKAFSNSLETNKRLQALEVQKIIKHFEGKDKLNDDVPFNSLLPGIYKGIDTDIDSLQKLKLFYSKLKNDILSVPKFGSTIYSSLRIADKNIFDWFFLQNGMLVKADLSIKNIRAILTKYSLGFSAENESLEFLLDESNSFIKRFESLQTTYRDAAIPTSIKLRELKELLKYRNLSIAAKRDFANNEITAKLKFTADINEADNQLALLNSLISLQEKVAKFIPEPAHKYFFSNEGYQNIQKLKTSCKEICNFIDDYTFLSGSGKEKQIVFWPKNNQEPILEFIYNKLNTIEIESESFNKWCEVANSLADVKEQGLRDLALSFLNFRTAIPFSEYTLLLEYLLYFNLSNEALKHYRILGSFSRITHENIRETFKSLDLEIQRINSKKLAYVISRKDVPSGLNGERSPKNFVDLRLLKHEIGKQKAHIPIRKLVAQSFNALAALKPCFMMGPLSVAQYLAPSHEKFDVLVIDEASQIKPEDAIGVLARAKQIVVVGDSNQLPPTGFFDMLTGDSDDEDDANIHDSESILDVCKPLFHPTRRLRWHYRSQHQSLISFSNHHFYDNDLVVFPSPNNNSEIKGVKHVYVEDGMYSSQSNPIEAQKLVAEFIEMTSKHPNLSYGIVTLNIKQKIVIEDEIERVRKENPVFNFFLDNSANTNEPYFVKNLENVQGDERDVIFISATFGLDEKGTFRQNFGPINGEKGWRRLNVLFTRAKQHIRIFSSFHSERIKVDGSKEQRGLRAFKDYLHYAATGNDNHSSLSNKEPDSDFERAVGGFLTKQGYQVIYQLGVAGYSIDLVIEHPLYPGTYVMAIECDGATYHSARTARDRDRLREENLKKLGWTHIHRIWSTDWFKRREQEEERLLNAVGNVLKNWKPN